MTLFEYVVLFLGERSRTAKGEDGNWKRKPAVLSFERILAKDEKEAGIIAARAIPETHISELERIQIAVRPF